MKTEDYEYDDEYFDIVLPVRKKNKKEYKMNNYITSQIRTQTPIIVGAFLSYLATVGLELDINTSAAFVVFMTGFLQAIYYTVARFLESRFPQLGFLLGTGAQPTYKEKK